MLYALDEYGNKIQPTKDQAGICPDCEQELIACMGDIKAHYWRHETTNKKCAFHNYEYETMWHAKWKNLFGADFSEIVVTNGNDRKVADVMLQNGTVLEVQRSSISKKTIASREMFHKKMFWLFDASGPYAEDRIELSKGYVYHWRHARQTVATCECPVFLHLGYDRIIAIKNIEMRWEPSEFGDFNVCYFLGLYEEMTVDSFKIFLLSFDNITRNDVFYSRWSTKIALDRITKHKRDQTKDANQLQLF